MKEIWGLDGEGPGTRANACREESLVSEGDRRESAGNEKQEKTSCIKFKPCIWRKRLERGGKRENRENNIALSGGGMFSAKILVLSMSNQREVASK